MDGYLVFDTYRGRMVNVYHAKTYTAAQEAKENLINLHKELYKDQLRGYGPVILLHLDTVPSWESKEEDARNGKGAKTIQESKARLI